MPAYISFHLHLHQVTFDFPVTVTRIVLSDPDGEAAAAAGAAGGEAAKPPQPPLLRAFARDLAHPSSCRFAALYASNMSVGGEQGGSSSSFATEVGVLAVCCMAGGTGG